MDDLAKNVKDFWSNAFPSSSSNGKFKGQGHRLGSGDSAGGSGAGVPSGYGRGGGPAGGRAPGGGGSVPGDLRKPASLKQSGAAAERVLHDRYAAQQQEMERQKEERRKAHEQQRAQERQRSTAGPSNSGSTGGPPASIAPAADGFDPFRPHFTSGAAAGSYAMLKRQEQQGSEPRAAGRTPTPASNASAECPVCGRFRGTEEAVAAHVDDCLAVSMATSESLQERAGPPSGSAPEVTAGTSVGDGVPASRDGPLRDGGEGSTAGAPSTRGPLSTSMQDSLTDTIPTTTSAGLAAIPSFPETPPAAGGGLLSTTPNSTVSSGPVAEAAVSGPEDDVREQIQHAAALLLSGNPSAATLDVLRKLLSNILGDPMNAKFRRIRLSNPKIAAAVGDVPGGLEILTSVGFETELEGGESWAVMRNESPKKTTAALREALSLLPGASDQPAGTPPGAASSPATTNASPAAPETKAPPPKFDRQVRVFLSTSENSGARIEVPDSFYDRSAEDLRQEMASRRKALESSQVLMTRASREKHKDAMKRKYKLCVIRVLMPDGIVLQGLFRPWELTSALYEFVAGALKDPTQEFALLHPVPLAGRSSIIPSVAQPLSPMPSLEKEQLVPASLVKLRPTCLGPPGYTGLIRELLERVEPLTSVPLPPAQK